MAVITTGELSMYRAPAAPVPKCSLKADVGGPGPGNAARISNAYVHDVCEAAAQASQQVKDPLLRNVRSTLLRDVRSQPAAQPAAQISRMTAHDCVDSTAMDFMGYLQLRVLPSLCCVPQGLEPWLQPCVYMTLCPAVAT